MPLRPTIGDAPNQAHERDILEAQKAEDEYKRQQQIQDRLYKEEEELRMREQEEEERR